MEYCVFVTLGPYTCFTSMRVSNQDPNAPDWKEMEVLDSLLVKMDVSGRRLKEYAVTRTPGRRSGKGIFKPGLGGTDSATWMPEGLTKWANYVVLGLVKGLYGDIKWSCDVN